MNNSNYNFMEVAALTLNRVQPFAFDERLTPVFCKAQVRAGKNKVRCFDASQIFSRKMCSLTINCQCDI